MNHFDQMRAAMSEAKSTMRAADAVVDQMAEMLIGRLRQCSPYYLKKLKREISGFNAHTRQWDVKKGGRS